MRIGIIADIHFGFGETDAVTETLGRVIDHFNTSFRPDATVVLGDLIHESDSPDTDHRRLKRLVELLGNLNAPVTYLLGNHDNVNLPYPRIREVLGQDRYGCLAGTDHVFLDSSAPQLAGARGALDEAQHAFLRDHLPTTQHTLVFVHHPIHYHDIHRNYWFATAPERAFCGDKKEVNAVIEESGGVLATFNGHLHETHHTSDRGLHHFTVNAFNRERPEAGVTGTYAEVTLGETLRVRIIEGDQITRTIEVPVPT